MGTWCLIKEHRRPLPWKFLRTLRECNVDFAGNGKRGKESAEHSESYRKQRGKWILRRTSPKSSRNHEVKKSGNNGWARRRRMKNSDWYSWRTHDKLWEKSLCLDLFRDTGQIIILTAMNVPENDVADPLRGSNLKNWNRDRPLAPRATSSNAAGPGQCPHFSVIQRDLDRQIHFVGE